MAATIIGSADGFGRDEKRSRFGIDGQTRLAWNRIGALDNHAPGSFTRLTCSSRYVGGG